MVSQIDEMARGLQAYVQEKYPNLYYDPTITFNSYKAMSLRGLESTKGYENYLYNLPGGQGEFNDYYGKLVIDPAENKCK